MMLTAIGIFFVFLLLGMPVAFAIGLSGFSFFMMADLPMTILVQKSISASQSFTMLAIPLFVLAGNLMNSCGITKRLMRFCNACTGHMKGNIGQVSCLLSTLIGCVSGSAVADAAMQCRILGPEMTRLGYAKGWSIQETVKYGWPFYLAIVGVILFMIFCPDAVLFLPNLVYGAGG